MQGGDVAVVNNDIQVKNNYIYSKRICIAVATHKPYRMPKDSMYMPLQVGKSLHPEVNLGFQADSTGDNISSLNAAYSELTAMYWLWKNNDANYKGLVHYRRHFASRRLNILVNDRFDRIISYDEMMEMLNSTDIVLPKKRNYYIETIYSHYVHTFSSEHLEIMRRIMEETQPEYLPAYDRVMQSRSAHLFNMFVMREDKFNAYCEWLFPLLEELTKRIDASRYDAFNARYPGRVSEMLLDVWLMTEKYDYAELPVVSTEPVNWVKKGTSFLMAKFFGKKYKKSF